jgi:hypothetical protein
MRAMRVSLVARYVSHPVMDFGRSRRAGTRSRLGLNRSSTVYHRPRRSVLRQPTIGALRSQTSRFRFPSVGRLARIPARRAVSPFGLLRARRS